MSNERPDEFLSWRSRLGQPGALPEQDLDDREMTWEKLYERLREKPRRQWTRYWMAAACLLLVLIPAFRLFRDRPAAVAIRPAVRVSPGRPEKTAPPQESASKKKSGATLQETNPSTRLSLEDIADLSSTPPPVFLPRRFPRPLRSLTCPVATGPANTSAAHPIPPPGATPVAGQRSFPDSLRLASSSAGSPNLGSPANPANPSLPRDGQSRYAPLRVVHINELNNPSASPGQAITVNQHFQSLNIRITLPSSNH